jgi:hypothetical protein
MIEGKLHGSRGNCSAWLEGPPLTANKAASVILSAAKNLALLVFKKRQILRCAQDDTTGSGIRTSFL